jgi:Predicted nucleotide-binding protein containing TIR-like domain
MARRAAPPPVKRPAELSATQMQFGIDRLTKVLDRVRQFDPRSVTEQSNIPHVKQLSAAIDDALARTFGQDTIEYERYQDATYFDNGPFNYAYEVPIGEVHNSLARSKASSVGLLEQAIESLKDRLAEHEALSEPDDPPYAIARAVPPASNVAVLSNKVFLVHGRDDAVKNEVALFLGAIGLNPIILHMRPNGGRHLLTKFAEESEGAAFAVVLMTPDDEGGIAGVTDHRPRARQNVVFELGFFIGKLGSANIAALLKGEVEKPSDFDGIGYISFDAGGRWKTELARELHHAKVPFDPAKAFTA